MSLLRKSKLERRIAKKAKRLYGKQKKTVSLEQRARQQVRRVEKQVRNIGQRTYNAKIVPNLKGVRPRDMGKAIIKERLRKVLLGSKKGAKAILVEPKQKRRA